MRYVPDVGHIIKIDMDPSVGHEPGGWRPALVLSPDAYNGRTGLLVAVPVTNQQKRYPFEVKLQRTRTTGVVLADQIKNLDWHFRGAKYVETAPPELLKDVQERVALLLNLTQR